MLVEAVHNLRSTKYLVLSTHFSNIHRNPWNIEDIELGLVVAEKKKQLTSLGVLADAWVSFL